VQVAAVETVLIPAAAARFLVYATLQRILKLLRGNYDQPLFILELL